MFVKLYTEHIHKKNMVFNQVLKHKQPNTMALPFFWRWQQQIEPLVFMTAKLMTFDHETAMHSWFLYSSHIFSIWFLIQLLHILHWRWKANEPIQNLHRQCFTNLMIFMTAYYCSIYIRNNEFADEGMWTLIWLSAQRVCFLLIQQKYVNSTGQMRINQIPSLLCFDRFVGLSCQQT